MRCYQTLPAHYLILQLAAVSELVDVIAVVVVVDDNVVVVV